MNETTKRIVDELNALYHRASDEYFELHQLSLKAQDKDSYLDSEVIERELRAALEVCNALFSASLKSGKARAAEHERLAQLAFEKRSK